VHNVSDDKLTRKIKILLWGWKILRKYQWRKYVTCMESTQGTSLIIIILYGYAMGFSRKIIF